MKIYAPVCDVTGAGIHLSHYQVELHNQDDAETYDLCRDHAIQAIEEWLDYKAEQWQEIRILKRE